MQVVVCAAGEGGREGGGCTNSGRRQKAVAEAGVWGLGAEGCEHAMIMRLGRPTEGVGGALAAGKGKAEERAVVSLCVGAGHAMMNIGGVAGRNW